MNDGDMLQADVAMIAMLAEIDDTGVRMKIMQMLLWFGVTDTTEFLWRALRRIDAKTKRYVRFEASMMRDANAVNPQLLLAELRCIAGDQMRLLIHRESALQKCGSVLMCDAMLR